MAECVAEQFENVCFLLVGDGPLRKQIEQEVTSRGLNNQFVFAGNRCDVPRILTIMDVFVMPSHFEGFGTVVIEAQICGLPVVANNLPSIREALCPSMYTFCCDSNAPEAMAEQVLLLLNNNQLRKNIARQSRKYIVDRFSIDRTVKQLESVYKTT